MNKKEIQSIVNKCDHTNLKQTATWTDIKSLCDDAIKYGAYSVCIPPSYVSKVVKTYGTKIKVCTVIGFPNGYASTEVKRAETYTALLDGATEIDMVININDVKNKTWKRVEKEIKTLASACHSFDAILKVIIETCLLTDNEKIKMCKIVSSAGADFIKTSTGFSTGGATVDDVKLLRTHVDKNVQVKAAGGISSLEDAQAMIDAGASRLGTSKVVNLVKEMDV